MGQPMITSISPFFIGSGVDQSVEFYREKLGFEVTFRAPEEDAFFAIVAREGAQIPLKSHGGIAAQPNHTRHPFLAWDAFLYAPDPDALAVDLNARGATFSGPLSDTNDGLRGFEVTDCDGYVLFLEDQIDVERMTRGANHDVDQSEDHIGIFSNSEHSSLGRPHHGREGTPPIRYR